MRTEALMCAIESCDFYRTKVWLVIPIMVCINVEH